MAGEVEFGRYVLERRLGAGGMAEVLLARFDGPEGFAKRVVIKRILPALAHQPELTRMFLDEARLAALFRHPNLIEVYELFEVAGQYAMAVEYLEGVDVADLAERHQQIGEPVSVTVALRLIADAAAGLRYAHELEHDGEALNIVHRDISPSNLFVTWDGVVKVVDFGIAKSTRAAHLTQAGWIRGKVGYMSPEQTRGETLDARSDIFSLGVVLHELLAGRPCYEQRTDDPEIVTAIRAGDRVPLSRPELPPAVVDLVERMLEIDRERRIDSAALVRREALQLLRAQGATEDELALAVRERFEDTTRITLVTSVGAEEFPVDPSEDVRVSGDLLDTVRRDATEYDPAYADTLIRDRSGEGTVIVHYDAATPSEPASAPSRSRWPLVAGLAVIVAVAASVFLWTGMEPAQPPAASTAPSRGEDPPMPELERTVEREVASEPEREVGVEPDEPRADRAVRLAITSEPVTDVWINGRRAGRTPVRRRVTAGTLRVRLENKKLGVKRELTIPSSAGAAVSRHVVFRKGNLVVSSQPWAEVWVRGKLLGTTPLPPTPLFEGIHKVRLRNPDLGLERTLTVRIEPGGTIKLREKLD